MWVLGYKTHMLVNGHFTDSLTGFPFHNVVEMRLAEVDACKWDPAYKMPRRQAYV